MENAQNGKVNYYIENNNIGMQRSALIYIYIYIAMNYGCLQICQHKYVAYKYKNNNCIRRPTKRHSNIIEVWCFFFSKKTYINKNIKCNCACIVELTTPYDTIVIVASYANTI